MLFVEGCSGRCDQFVDPNVWLTPPHHAKDLALMEESIREMHGVVSVLLDRVDSRYLQGVWLDICSNNGIAAIQACWPRGINLLHIDKSAGDPLPLREGRIAWLLGDSYGANAPQQAEAYLEQNFLAADVEELAQDPTPIFERVPPTAISGALLLNPPGIPSALRSSVQLAARVLPEGGPLLITTDPFDIQDVATINQQLDALFSSKTEISIPGRIHGIIATR